jgi:eukaryotic-like serine/threonine-protein kinase
VVTVAEPESGKSSEPKLNPGSPTEPAPFGKYELLGLIARGGMAEVYRARPKTNREQTLAVKCMRPQLAREARFVDMFVREGKLAILLKHPSIVDTLDVGRTEGRYFIAMEYIGGKDLTQVLRRCQEANQRIPVPHAIYIAARISEGLHHAHNLVGDDGRPLNIVNRDVSPSNVRLSYSGGVKMLDFGIAQALMKFTSEIGVLKGKFSYMSPEQIRGMPVDARTDIFSAGIILHEMLTTEKLFRGDTEFALMEKVRKAEISPPSKFNRRVPAELDAIVARALARDVADRYQTAEAFAQDLDQLLVGYRFDPSELRELVRSLFRSDYAKEEEEMRACRTSQAPGERAASVPAAAVAPAPETPQAESPAPPTPTPAATTDEEKRGLWAKIRSKFGKPS